jgi:hypothetical protein
MGSSGNPPISQTRTREIVVCTPGWQADGHLFSGDSRHGNPEIGTVAFADHRARVRELSHVLRQTRRRRRQPTSDAEADRGSRDRGGDSAIIELLQPFRD